MLTEAFCISLFSPNLISSHHRSRLLYIIILIYILYILILIALELYIGCIATQGGYTGVHQKADQYQNSTSFGKLDFHIICKVKQAASNSRFKSIIGLQCRRFY